ncbi:ABC transporter substrate-binding protein [Staphylococcus massiliensis]|uniref:ABC transporter substrate-binding protein n=1 Tax=Staphylococcus massiliensis TaxID=555791 RepID=UPI001EDF1418|nr:Fe(3+) dicitrate ABC transporter substrate-binding protein [Staphylococcus massiliensis]MCG3402572.1 ABC transporter substrate-binding protein [Staphylococcus massiliensis]
MNKMKLIGIISLVFLLTFVTACGSVSDSGSKGGSKKAEPKEGVEIKHDGGTTKVPKNPKKVVALEYSFVDALVALGVKPVGIADDGKKENIIEPLRDKVGDYKSVGSRKQPNLEVISETKPDLIIADSNRHKNVYKELNKIAPTIMLPSLDSGYKQNLEAFKTIGKALSKEDKAEQRLKDHKAKIDKLKKQITMDKEKTVLPGTVTESGVYAHSDKSYVGEFLRELGFKEALNKDVSDKLPEYLNSPYLQMNSEQLSEVNPKRMFLMVKGEDDPSLKKMEQDKVWKRLDAVQNDNVHTVDRQTWSKFRGLISSEEIAKELVEISKKEK